MAHMIIHTNMVGGVLGPELEWTSQDILFHYFFIQMQLSHANDSVM